MSYEYGVKSGGIHFFHQKPMLRYYTDNGVDLYRLFKPQEYSSTLGGLIGRGLNQSEDLCIYANESYLHDSGDVLPFCWASYKEWWDITERGGEIEVPGGFNRGVILNSESGMYWSTGPTDLVSMPNNCGILLGNSKAFTSKMKGPLYDQYDSKIHRRPGSSRATFIRSNVGLAYTMFDLPANTKTATIMSPYVEAIVATRDMHPNNVEFFCGGVSNESDIGNSTNASWLQSNYNASGFRNVCEDVGFSYLQNCRLHESPTATLESASCACQKFEIHDITPSSWGTSGKTLNNGELYTKLWYVYANSMGGKNNGASGYHDPNWAYKMTYGNFVQAPNPKLIMFDPVIQFGPGPSRFSEYKNCPSGSCAIVDMRFTVSVINTTSW